MMLNDFLIFVIGIFATFFTLWSTMPQIRKALRTRKTDDVSKWLIISLIAGLIVVLYGALKEDMIITGANRLVSLNTFLLILKLNYTKTNKELSKGNG